MGQKESECFAPLLEKGFPLPGDSCGMSEDPKDSGSEVGSGEVPPCPECGEANWAVIYDLTLGVGVTEDRIDRVVVEDENLGPIRRVVCRECDFQVHDEEARAHPAARIAERDEWPAWEFGW